MATATQISTRALKRLGVIDSHTTPNAADIADANEELTSMIVAFEGRNLSGDVTPFDARFEQPIVDMLVVRLAPMFGKQPTALQMKQADEGWSAIQAAFFVVPDSVFDNALIYTGHDTDSGFILGEQRGEFADWVAETEYTLRSRVVNGSNIYECVFAGTSDISGGPTGTSSEITDGTVVWCWRAVTS